MTPENKELLLKYLCMALPYGLICNINGEDVTIGFIGGITGEIFPNKSGIGFSIYEDTIKPYLRSMSSMTEEELKEFTSIHENVFVVGKNIYTAILDIDSINWLLEHHFDFMGLIPKNLAIEVIEDNNPYKD